MIGRCLGLVLILAVLPILHGCTSSCGSVLSTGRAVEVTSDTLFVKAVNNKDTSTIDLGGKQVVVQPTRVTIDGAQVATLDEQARKIVVVGSKGKIAVTADGKRIYDSSDR